MAKQTIYTVGGTVQAGAGIYVKRKADEELLELCRQGELAFILSSRQVGKSSLMTQTAEQLRKEDIHSAIVDLSSIGTKVTQEEWYLGILNVIATDLQLEADIFAWWAQYSGLGAAQRFFNFLRDVLLREIKARIVLFFDEIDTTLSIPFANDFFASVRATYNSRSTTPDFKRLSFVLVGVATPSDLISDEKRTPFNIGRRVELNDFTLQEAFPLAQGLGEHAEQVLAWILDWSGGHPYLTQRLCDYISKSNGAIDKQTVGKAATDLFLGEKGKQDNNLQFVRDLLVKRSPDVRKGMLTYLDIRSGKKIQDDERSPVKAHLKMSGVVKRQSGQLVTRNRIYERVFDLKWIKENTPSALPRRIMIGSTLVVALALFIAAYFAYQEYSRNDEERSARFETNFRATNDPEVRLKNLAGILELKDKSFGVRARSLFKSLSQNEKLLLFKPTNSPSMMEDQISVTQGIYQSLDNTPEENAVLEAMGDAIKTAKPDLANEIFSWVDGREALAEKQYYDSKSALTNAIHWNGQNPVLYFDRAQVFILMGEETYPNALDDLTQMIKLDPDRIAAARLLIEKNTAFSLYWSQNRGKFPALAGAIPTFDEILDNAGVVMVLIPAGDFVMGSDSKSDSDSQPNEWPAHTVNLDAYYFDRYEVTNKLYNICVDQGVCSIPVDLGSATHSSYFGNSQYDNYPVISVDWYMATAYCEWRGARLPTEAEWEMAARGTDGRTFPWGNDMACANANVDNCVGDTTAVGSYERGQSPYGVYDLSGNVWEWVSSLSQPYPYVATDGREDLDSPNPSGAVSGEGRVTRGGSWNSGYPTHRSAYRDWSDPAFASPQIGFRCARDASP